MVDVHIKTSASFELLRIVGSRGVLTVTMPQGWRLTRALNGGDPLARTVILLAEDIEGEERLFVGSNERVTERVIITRNPLCDDGSKKISFNIEGSRFLLTISPRELKRPSTLFKNGDEDGAEMEILW